MAGGASSVEIWSPWSGLAILTPGYYQGESPKTPGERSRWHSRPCNEWLVESSFSPSEGSHCLQLKTQGANGRGVESFWGSRPMVKTMAPMVFGFNLQCHQRPPRARSLPFLASFLLYRMGDNTQISIAFSHMSTLYNTLGMCYHLLLLFPSMESNLVIVRFLRNTKFCTFLKKMVFKEWLNMKWRKLWKNKSNLSSLLSSASCRQVQIKYCLTTERALNKPRLTVLVTQCNTSFLFAGSEVLWIPERDYSRKCHIQHQHTCFIHPELQMEKTSKKKLI